MTYTTHIWKLSTNNLIIGKWLSVVYTVPCCCGYVSSNTIIQCHKVHMSEPGLLIRWQVGSEWSGKGMWIESSDIDEICVTCNVTLIYSLKAWTSIEGSQTRLISKAELVLGITTSVRNVDKSSIHRAYRWTWIFHVGTNRKGMVASIWLAFGRRHIGLPGATFFLFTWIRQY